MPIETPNLDDRDFLQLVNEAVQRIQATSPEWTDFGPGDPGMTLVEAFAHLTEVMIYRLNRVPDKAYRAYLNMIGVQLRPPSAARTTLRFTRADPESAGAIEIPRGTRVTVTQSGGGEPPTFVVAEPATLPAGAQDVEVRAYHCTLVNGELLGVTSGESGQSFAVARAPIAQTPGLEPLVVAVEATREELPERTPAREFEGKEYALWSEVRDFSETTPATPAFIVDRAAGRITFAPALGPGREESLALTPPPGREVRAWYATGGGPEGNVAAGTLTTLVDPLPLTVTNIDRATGGRSVEPVEQALIRGPREFNVRDRAVTARDYELIALRSGLASRARAFTAAQYWTFAARGTVDVVLVPHVEMEARPGGRVRLEDLAERSRPDALADIARELDLRRPLGVACEVRWAEYKRVAARARVAVRREEDAAALRERVLERLHQTINPLPAGRPVRASEGRSWPGWPFGQALRVSDVYDILLAEPGVAWADRVRLVADEVPGEDVTALAMDRYQPGTWFAAAGSALFRSVNDGEGWELVQRLEGERIERVEPYPREPGRGGLGEHPGLLAVATSIEGEEGSRVYVTRDLGQTWDPEPVAQFAFQVEDLAWVQRDQDLALLIATDRGLYEQRLIPGATPVQLSVDPAQGDLGFYQVVAYTEPRGAITVAAAAQRTGGIFLSRLEGRSGTFNPAGLQGEDVRTLALQYDGTATFLWAGTAAEGGGRGNGCFRARLEEDELRWEALSDGWEGGSCWAIAFTSDFAFGASHQAGVQRIPLRADARQWWRPAVGSGLPLREVGRFHPVRALDVEPGGSVLLSGGPAGVHRSVPGDDALLGERYDHASSAEFDSAVTLPPTWLFVSGDHEIDVVVGNEARSD